MDFRPKNEQKAKMFHVKHFRRPFVEKNCTFDMGELWKTPLELNCANSGDAVTIIKDDSNRQSRQPDVPGLGNGRLGLRSAC
jgi:hypothetical protein